MLPVSNVNTWCFQTSCIPQNVIRLKLVLLLNNIILLVLLYGLEKEQPKQYPKYREGCNELFVN